MYTEVVLVREEDADNRTLGEILIEKAEEGCVVFIMVCNMFGVYCWVCKDIFKIVL